MRRFLLPLLVALCAAGCSTFRMTQEDAFIDDDGNVLQVRYGEMSRPYTYEIVSPVNGHALECTDKKAVRVRLPDPSGEWLSCYICQNLLPKGTMYGTRDGKWRYLTIGLGCRLYLQNETKDDYICVFEGRFLPEGSSPKGASL